MQNSLPSYHKNYESSRPLLPKNLSAILVLLITFQNKIEQLKSKLCSFSEFSPEKSFSAIDSSEKGFITSEDISRNLNGRFEIRFIQKMIARMNPEGCGSEKLSYFGYLNLLRPYFDEILSRDLLSRDSLSKRFQPRIQSHQIHTKSPRNGDSRRRIPFLPSEQNVENSFSNRPFTSVPDSPIEATVQSLLFELLSIECIFSTEHEQAKEGLLTQHMTSVYEISEILEDDNFSFSQSQDMENSLNKISMVNPLKRLLRFIQNYSEYEVDQDQIKGLLAYCRCHEYVLLSQKYLTVIFMPSSGTVSTIGLKQNPQKTLQKFHQSSPIKDDRQRQIPFRKTFLDYTHPKSIPSLHRIAQERQQVKSKGQNQNRQRIENLYQRLGLSMNLNDGQTDSKFIQEKNRQQGDYIKEDESKIFSREDYCIEVNSFHPLPAPSKMKPSANPNPSLQNLRSSSSNNNAENLQLPILQRFMKESNIMKNMSRSRKMYENPHDSSQHQNHNYAENQSNFQDESSSAFQAVQYVYSNSNQNNIRPEIPIHYIPNPQFSQENVRYERTGERGLKHEHPELKNILEEKLVLSRQSQYLPSNAPKPGHNYKREQPSVKKSKLQVPVNIYNENPPHNSQKEIIQHNAENDSVSRIHNQNSISRGNLSNFKLDASNANDDQSLVLDQFLMKRRK